MDGDSLLDLRVRDLQAVLEQAVKEQLLPVLLGPRAFEVDQDRTDPLDLRERVGATVAH